MSKKITNCKNLQAQVVMRHAWALYRAAPARWFNRSRFAYCLARAWAQVKAERAAAPTPLLIISADPARLAALRNERIALEMSDGNLATNNLRLRDVNAELQALAA